MCKYSVAARQHFDKASKSVEVAFAPLLDRVRPFSASKDLFIWTLSHQRAKQTSQNPPSLVPSFITRSGRKL